MYTDFQVTTSVEPGPDSTDGLNYIGSADGFISFKFKPTVNFPVYGGSLTFTVPNWYSGLSPESTF